jgi:hypothetical protein
MGTRAKGIFEQGSRSVIETEPDARPLRPRGWHRLPALVAPRVAVKAASRGTTGVRAAARLLP